jgi:hypothetical protein
MLAAGPNASHNRPLHSGGVPSKISLMTTCEHSSDCRQQQISSRRRVAGVKHSRQTSKELYGVYVKGLTAMHAHTSSLQGLEHQFLLLAGVWSANH